MKKSELQRAIDTLNAQINPLITTRSVLEAMQREKATAPKRSRKAKAEKVTP